MPMDGGSMYGHKGMSGAGYYGEGGKSSMRPVGSPTPLTGATHQKTGGYKAPKSGRSSYYTHSSGNSY